MADNEQDTLALQAARFKEQIIAKVEAHITKMRGYAERLRHEADEVDKMVAEAEENLAKIKAEGTS